MPIQATRTLLTAALNGTLAKSSFRKDPYFGFEVPEHLAGVPDILLDPRRTWHDAAAYDAQAVKLVNLFAENFEQYLPYIDEEVKAAKIGEAVEPLGIP